MPRPRRAPRLATSLLAGLLAACGPTAPTPAPTPDPSATPRPATEVYAGIRTDVEAIRALRPTADVEPVSLDVETLTRNLAAEFDASSTPDELADAEAILIALGLLPKGGSIRQLTLDLQEGQVAGYYSPEKDELYVVLRSGAIGPAERVTYAHEFTHQLQDQALELDGLGIDAVDQTDAALAALALVEGDAVSVQTSWMTNNLTPSEMGELIAVALAPASLEALQNAPRYLRETLLFPYQDGAALVARLLAEGGFARVNAAYTDPPESTEQVLHPDAYLQREPPVAVEIPAGIAASLGTGWEVAAQDTLGELMLRIWLRDGGLTLPEARTASAGWGGDRLVLLRGPDGQVGVGLRTAWDTAADAQEFATAADATVGALGLRGQVVHDQGSSEVIVAVGDKAAEVASTLRG